jgi:hypothetical protein
MGVFHTGAPESNEWCPTPMTAPHVVASARATIHTIHITATQSDLSIKEIKDAQFDRPPYRFRSRLHDAEYCGASRERPAKRVDASDEHVQFDGYRLKPVDSCVQGG